ncbi:MAG: YafY family transcriptional regulator [Oscillospiraceae bacterium]|nr:YafY family transcriptional regulator [Oscillospiraceae bacterium]
MQINRLFEIVHLLMNQKRITANDLASHFEVSKRTILRDIDTLTTAGIPIYTTQGKGGGIFIQDNFVLNKTLVSEEEQKQILFSLQSMSATEFIDTEQVLGRLRSFFASPSKEWVEVDFSRWGHSEVDNAKFELLKNAIIHEFAVAFDYLSPYGEYKGREVYPLKLSFKSKAWYLQSFCLAEQDYRVFKFTRINNMVVLDQSFNSGDYEIPPMKSVEEAAPPDFIHVRLFISQNAKYRIYDEFAESDITVNEDGSFTLRTALGQWIYDYILSYGTAVEVVEPQYMRDELLAHVEKIKNKYLPRT